MHFCEKLNLVLLLLFFEYSGHCKGCPKILSINLTGGKRFNSTIVKNGIHFDESHYFFQDGIPFGCVCDVKTCVRMCCDSNRNSSDNTSCESNTSSLTFYNLEDVSNTKLSDYFFLTDGSCEPGYFKVLLEETFYLQTNGSLYGSDLQTDKYMMYSPREYCLESGVGGNGSDLQAFVCLMPDESDRDESTTFHTIGMIISMPCLLLTFLVYAILPETSLHRRALMSYVLTLLVGYILIVTVQLNNGPISPTLCQLIGYSIIFFFTVSFCWMNVMCVDMWLAFSGMKGFNGTRGTEKKRFIIYCLYAWGAPLLHVIIVFLINTYGDMKASYHPRIGDRKCFVEDGLPNLYYFYLPMAIIIMINIVLFILTTVKIQRVKKETSMLKHTDSKRHSYEDDKQKFNLYLKLMLAMGINWSMELISWAVAWKLTKVPTWIWYLTDCTNALYGLVIFLIFVCKKKIWISLKKRYYVWIGKPHLAHALSTSTRSGTRTSTFSTKETGVNSDYRLSDMQNGKEEGRALNRN